MITPYRLGLTESTFGYAKVDLNTNKRLTVNARNVRHNFLGKTIAQYGATYRTWSGVLYFDTESELTWLRQLNSQRLIYFIDSTNGTNSDPVQVYWGGKFSPVYHELDLSSGSVAFQFEEVTP